MLPELDLLVRTGRGQDGAIRRERDCLDWPRAAREPADECPWVGTIGYIPELEGAVVARDGHSARVWGDCRQLHDLRTGDERDGVAGGAREVPQPAVPKPLSVTTSVPSADTALATEATEMPTGWPSTRSVGVGPVLDGGYQNDQVLVVDLVQHPVAAAARGPGALIGRQKQWLSEPARVLQKGCCDELMDRHRDLLREPAGERARCRTRDP